MILLLVVAQHSSDTVRTDSKERMRYSPFSKEKRPRRGKKGFLLVEVILSSALFVLLVTTLVVAYLYGQESTVLAGNRGQAATLAEEGLEAVRNIRDHDFADLINGTYGLVISGDTWALSGSSDTVGIFTREIEISSIDEDRKEIQSTVTWEQNPQREGSVSLASYLTNWSGPQCPSQADLLDVNTASADLVGGNRNIVGITVENTGAGCGDIVIDIVTTSWAPTNGNPRMVSVLIDGVSVWSGNVTTGTAVNINDTSLPEGGTVQTTEYRFNRPMQNRTFTITFSMGDGSIKTISGINP